jgi:hypothetical protein
MATRRVNGLCKYPHQQCELFEMAPQQKEDTKADNKNIISSPPILEPTDPYVAEQLHNLSLQYDSILFTLDVI